MVTLPTLAQRTFRISVDIETTLMPSPDETIASCPAHRQFHQALVQQLLEHPQRLDQLFRSCAVDALKEAEKMLAGEYQVSEHHLLQPMIEALEPAAQAYFLEEIEAGISVYYFDGYGASVKCVGMTELQEQ
jgi:hypothetical protein